MKWNVWQLSMLAIINLGAGMCFGVMLTEHFSQKKKIEEDLENKNECQHESNGGCGPVHLCNKCYEYFTECQHESDGLMLLSYPGKYKCIKCGEFYKC